MSAVAALRSQLGRMLGVLVLRRLETDRRAHISLVFGLSAVTIVTGVGAGVDVGRAYFARQQLNAVVNLTCQYASRGTLQELAFGVNGLVAYVTQVTSFANTALGSQKFAYAQKNPNPFTYTSGTTATVSMASDIPTSFMGIAGIRTIPVSSTSTCHLLAVTPSTTANSVAVQEGFENNACSGNCFWWYLPSGQIIIPGTGGAMSPTTATPSTVGYVGLNGIQWLISGYCLEVDSVGLIRNTVPEGTHSAELDCDNGSGTQGNSSISTKAYLQTGAYELRWNYTIRLDYPTYDPAYICGNTASDTSWANDAISFFGTATRSNQINVYLDQNTTGSPPSHTTLDGTQNLAGANLIDTCVYATNWIQRSVKINVTTAGYYWLSFAADGHNDSYGGQIDNILLCQTACTGAVQDNFPPSWLPANNGGNNLVMFEDTFESPVYAATGSTHMNTGGNLNNSLGTSGASTSGWPNAPATGWTTGPTNQVTYTIGLSAQGAQAVQLGIGTNQYIGRPFLLMPGYYQVAYNYVSDSLFSVLTLPNCGSTLAALNSVTLSGSATATNRLNSAITANVARNTNEIGLYIGYGDNGEAVPSVLPSLLLDVCAYSPVWQIRTSNILIQKPAYYWFGFSAIGTASPNGGAIDDVKLIALGSPYMLLPPSNPVTIPVPNPQPGSTLNFTGFSIVADRLTP